MSASGLKNALHGEHKVQEELRLTIRNELGELVRVNQLVSELLARRGIAESVVYATQLALEEVLSNVIRHGYEDCSQHEIALTLRVHEGRVELQVVDDGREFDPATAPAPDLDLPLVRRRAGGLGIHLLRAFVSEIRYQRLGQHNSLLLRI
jgi:anti-sigma regulatory factor (Ser/Thr protein kinase)